MRRTCVVAHSINEVSTTCRCVGAIERVIADMYISKIVAQTSIAASNGSFEQVMPKKVRRYVLMPRCISILMGNKVSSIKDKHV
jgi:hypothetical protein